MTGAVVASTTRSSLVTPASRGGAAVPTTAPVRIGIGLVSSPDGMTGRGGGGGGGTVDSGRVASSDGADVTIGTSPVMSATPRSEAPHSMQNFCPGRTSVPHE